MIYNIPIEKYEERYTEQWSRWFPEAYKELGLDFINIEGEQLVDSVETGAVLDVYGTHYYKFTQLQKIMKMLRNGEIGDNDILFFHDLWFPGIEALQYIRNMTGKRFKIWGILHAGTWDEHDFTFLNGMRNWGKHIEKGWLNFFDRVFLGSEFHKELISIYNDRNFSAELVVTGLPFDCDEVDRTKPKEKIVVFPHRLDKEKNPDTFDWIAKQLKDRYPEWQFIKSKDVCKTKEEYFQLLGRSAIAVSFAEQETFGYAMLEAMANGCVPIVPNKLSYETMAIYDGYRFDQVGEAMAMIENQIDIYEKMPERAFNYRSRLLEYKPINIINKIFNEN